MQHLWMESTMELRITSYLAASCLCLPYWLSRSTSGDVCRFGNSNPAAAMVDLRLLSVFWALLVQSLAVGSSTNVSQVKEELLVSRSV